MIGSKSMNDVLCLLSGYNIDKRSFERDWRLSSVLLPALKLCCGGRCMGCKYSGGLYLQCEKLGVDGDYCKSCVGSFISEGRPKHGIISERLECENWTTDEGKRPITWMQYLKKKGFTREDGERLAASKGVTIPESEWVLPKRKGRCGAGTSDTDSEGGTEKHTTRYLPLDTYKGVSPSNVDYAHKGKDGVPLRVKKYQDGRVLKSNPKNWTDEANAKFVEMYGAEGFEEKKTRKKRNKTHANDEAVAAMQAELEKLRAQIAEKNSSGEETTDEVDEEVPEEKNQEDEAKKKKAEKKARAKAERLAKKKATAEKKKKEQEEAAAALKAKQEAELKALQEKLNAPELEEDLSGSDSEFDSESDDDEEETEFNAFSHDGEIYHKDDEGKLHNKENEEVGYVNDEEEVVMYE